MAAALVNCEVGNQSCGRPGCSSRFVASYCATCQEVLCDSHKKTHDAHFEREHESIPVEDYVQAPERFQKSYCSKHANCEIVKVCKFCERQICDECNTQDGKCAEDEKCHEFVSPEALAKDVASYYNGLQNAGRDKLSQLNALSQSALKQLEMKEEQCAEKISEIERCQNEKIQILTEKGNHVKNDIFSYERAVKEKIKLYRSELVANMNGLERVCTDANKLEKSGNVLLMLSRKQHVAEEINSKVKVSVEELNLPDQPPFTIEDVDTTEEQMAEELDGGVFLPRVLTVSLLVILLACGAMNAAWSFPNAPAKDEIMPLPKASKNFTYLASTKDLGSSCLSAFYRADGNILVGTRDGVKLVNRRNLAVTSFNTPFKEVTSIVEHHNVIYLLHEAGNVAKVELCLPEMNNCQTLVEFSNPTLYTSTMAVSNRYIVVKNPNGDKLIIYDFISKQSKIKQPVQLYRPYFLPDGHLLTKNGQTLTKYRLEDGELTELWTCDGLTHLWAMVADTDGFIYGLAPTKKSVYVISPDGELLPTIHNDNLPSGGRQASISGDEIAVPGWGDKKLYIFKINK